MSVNVKTTSVASIYDAHGNEITTGLQGCTVCDEAIQAARRIAADRGHTVWLDDDDGLWAVDPDGTTTREDD